MNAFNARFTEFCAGNGDLDQVIAALESDLRDDRQSCERNSSLIELAWRTGKLGGELAYQHGAAGAYRTGARAAGD